MKFTLKNGVVVEIREVLPADKPRDFRDFIGKIIRERPEPFILTDRVPSVKEEATWLASVKDKVKKRQNVMLVAWHNGKLVGVTDGRRGPNRDRDKVGLGLSIAREYRGQGLGKKLLVEIVKLTKKRLKPQIIYLTVVGGNEIAQRLYEKVGFVKIAALPKWQKIRGKYWDFIYMRLK